LSPLFISGWIVNIIVKYRIHYGCNFGAVMMTPRARKTRNGQSQRTALTVILSLAAVCTGRVFLTGRRSDRS
jgi:hypothetical protein